MQPELTREFTERICAVHPVAGRTWLDQLPALLTTAQQEWDIEILPPFRPLRYNYAAPVREGRKVRLVLKAGVPCRALRNEITTLQHFDGHGMVKLIKADPDRGLMLLERIEPGKPIFEIEDDASTTRIFASYLARSKRAPLSDGNLPHISEWFKAVDRIRDGFNGTTGPLPAAEVSHMEKLVSELLDSMSGEVVLHGDLHHWNLLSATREPWLALDPHGVIGEPECEVAVWLRNPYPYLLKYGNLKGVIVRRVEILEDVLGFDRTRIIGWGYCQAVLSGIWSFEEGADDWDQDFVIAGVLRTLI